MSSSPQKPAFSVVVCTYNRSALLAYCLEALREAIAPKVEWELLVVDNNSPDDTPEVVKAFQQKMPVEIRYLLEEKVGLSNARNRGLEESRAPYVLYLDDDAKVATDFLQRLEFLTQERDYDIVGGIYLPWYHYGQPQWFLDRYASNKRNDEPDLRVMQPPYRASGGVMLCKCQLLHDLGGFDPRVGMVGNKIAYGEESFLQMKAYKRGAVIAYDPHLIIYHIVAEYKLSVDFMIRSRYARGRDQIIGEAKSRNDWAVAKYLIYGLGHLVVNFFEYTPRWIIRKDYLRENWLIDLLQLPAEYAGLAYTAFLRNNEAE